MSNVIVNRNWVRTGDGAAIAVDCITAFTPSDEGSSTTVYLKGGHTLLVWMSVTAFEALLVSTNV